MQKLKTILAAVTIAGAVAIPFHSAQAWNGPGWGNSNWGPFDGDGTGDFSMNFSGRGAGSGSGYGSGYGHPGYGGYGPGYGAPGYGPGYGYAPAYGPGYGYAPAPGYAPGPRGQWGAPGPRPQPQQQQNPGNQQGGSQ